MAISSYFLLIKYNENIAKMPVVSSDIFALSRSGC